MLSLFYTVQMSRAHLVANKVSPGSSKNCCSGTSAVPRSSTANFPNKYSGKGFRLLIFNVSTSSVNAVELIFEIDSQSDFIEIVY